MEWVETTGRSVVEAIDAALDQLGVDEQEAEIQILDEPQKGLFGRLRVEARIRARVRPTAPRAKVERRDRGHRKDRDRRRRKDTPQSSSRNSGTKTSTGGRSGEDVAARGQRAGGVVTETKPDAGSSKSSSSRNRRRKARSRQRQRDSAQENGSQQGVKVAESRSTDGEGSEPYPSLDIEPQRAAVDEFLTGLVGAFGRSDVEVLTETAEEDKTIVVEVQGEELGLLVGPRGQTLQALQELTRSMVQRRFVGEAHARLHLDVGGYRQRRTEALERFARSVAAEVLESGRSKALEPMSASDRKVIHDLVNTIDGVHTMSEGEEPERRVVIDKD